MKLKIFGLAAALVLIPFGALAATFTDVGNVAKTDKPKNLYVANQTVNVDGNVTGDLVAAGSTVSVNGDVESGLFVAGSTVFVRGNIGRSARILGGEVTINGKVNEDLFIFGGQVTIGKDAVVGGDVVLFAGALTMDGKIGGKVIGTGGDIVINGTVAKDVELKNVGSLTLGEAASLGGRLVYSAPASAKVATNTKIAGETKFTQIKNNDTNALKGAVSFFGLLGLVGTFVTLFVISKLVPKTSLAVVENAIAKPWANIGIGFAILVATPIAVIFALVTVIGAPVAVLAILGYILALVIAGLVLAMVAGSFLVKAFKKSDRLEITWQSLLAGVIAVAALKLVPALGWVVVFGLFLLSLGSLVTVAGQQIKSEQAK